ncbi:hypothetical protein HUJ04_007667 [Dendroctonus ponderosae]|nr:hypothetical protein HUJ04_007667 [Dendroctonus ponderosae]KAH1025775.1 hypothetical protein HUJ05_010433 [Dendroctonus ponderosae]
MMDKSFIFLLAAFVCSVGSAHIPTIPCPNYFRYVSDPYQNIEGLILVPYYQTPELLLAVNASMKGFFGQENSNMQLTMLTTATDLIQGLSTIVKYKLQFPVQDSIPQITSIIFNGQQFCTGPPVPNSHQTTEFYISRKMSLNSPIQNRVQRRQLSAGLLDNKNIPDQGNSYFYPSGYGVYDDSITFQHKPHPDEDTHRNFYDYSEEIYLIPMNRKAN